MGILSIFSLAVNVTFLVAVEMKAPLLANSIQNCKYIVIYIYISPLDLYH